MAATQRRKRPKVLLDGPASAAALKQPAIGLLHRALGERITLVVSQAIIEELAHHLAIVPWCMKPAQSRSRTPLGRLAELLSHCNVHGRKRDASGIRRCPSTGTVEGGARFNNSLSLTK